MNSWTLTVRTLLGDPLPVLPDIPGQLHECADRPLTDDELTGITSPTELALLTGLSRQTAANRLKAAAKARPNTESPTP